MRSRSSSGRKSTSFSRPGPSESMSNSRAASEARSGSGVVFARRVHDKRVDEGVSLGAFARSSAKCSWSFARFSISHAACKGWSRRRLEPWVIRSPLDRSSAISLWRCGSRAGSIGSVKATNSTVQRNSGVSAANRCPMTELRLGLSRMESLVLAALVSSKTNNGFPLASSMIRFTRSASMSSVDAALTR